jgi:hypothetical protein
VALRSRYSPKRRRTPRASATRCAIEDNPGLWRCHDLRHAADIGCDDGCSTRHRLEQHIRPTLSARREDERIGSRVVPA